MTPHQLCTMAVFGLLAATVYQRQPTVVGVLENTQCKKAGTVVVRALFAKPAGEWIPLDGRQAFEQTIRREMSWTVAFDGQSLGTIRTIDPRPEVKHEWAFVRDRVLDLAPGENPPRRANPNHRFDGWCDEAPDRPIVVVTPDNFRDPETWKPFAAGADTRSALLPAFRSAVDEVYVCPVDPEKAVRFRYTATDLKIVGAYRNRAGRTVVGIELDPTKDSCDGPPAESQWSPHWFVLDTKPVLLGAGLQLVDAGDYDADGRSELVFWFNGYNGNGYDLFADDFRKHITVRWSHH